MIDSDCSRFRGMSKVQFRKQRTTAWSSESVAAIFELWPQYIRNFPGNRENRRLYIEMANELRDYGVRVTPKELRVKINNMIQRYRQEKKTVDAVGIASDWIHYNDVDAILGLRTCQSTADNNNTSDVEELKCNQILPETQEIFKVELDPLDEQSFQGFSATTSKPSPVASISARPASLVEFSTSRPSFASTRKKRKKSLLKIQEQMFDEFRNTSACFLNEIRESRKALHKLANIHARFVESTIKFQSDLLEYMRSNKQ